MLKTKTDKLYALDFTDKFIMCSYINSMKGDIDIINAALSEGKDVRVQLTKEGYRIISDTVKVLKKAVIPQSQKISR